MDITIYTDGACRGNPGTGGWGCILQATLSNGTFYEKEHSKGYKYTTNNRMELLGVINALKYINGTNHKINIYTDSKYVSDPFITKNIYFWKRDNFKSRANKDLWTKLYDLAEKYDITFHWVKGHADNKYNNKCDELAVMASLDVNNQVSDEYYEKYCDNLKN